MAFINTPTPPELTKEQKVQRTTALILSRSQSLLNSMKTVYAQLGEEVNNNALGLTREEVIQGLGDKAYMFLELATDIKAIIVKATT